MGGFCCKSDYVDADAPPSSPSPSKLRSRQEVPPLKSSSKRSAPSRSLYSEASAPPSCVAPLPLSALAREEPKPPRPLDRGVSDIFDISDTSTLEDGGAPDTVTASSFVEVSQPTLSMRYAGPRRTFSDLDGTSEWEITYDHHQQRRRLRDGLASFLASEEEARGQLMTSAAAQFSKLGRRALRESFMRERSAFLQDYFSERIEMQLLLTLAQEQLGREYLALQWWVYRSAMLSAEMKERGSMTPDKEEELPLRLSTFTTGPDLSSSEYTNGDEDDAHMYSSSVRVVSSPHATRRASSAVELGAAASGTTRLVSPAQLALQSRMVRGVESSTARPLYADEEPVR